MTILLEMDSRPKAIAVDKLCAQQFSTSLAQAWQNWQQIERLRSVA